MTITVGGQTVEPNPQVMYFSTATRVAIWTSVFPVPANSEVVMKVKSPNAADTDVDVTAYLFEAAASVDLTPITNKLPSKNYLMGSADADGGFDSEAKADVNAEVDAAFDDYDPPTRAELTSDKDAIITEVNANETKIDTIDGVVDAIKSKTDNLPVDPADQSEIAGLIAALNDPSAAEIANAVLAKTGITEGGTWTFAKLMKILAAWTMGLARDKEGEDGVVEILDPDDGSTVIAELSRSDTTPYKTVTVKI